MSPPRDLPGLQYVGEYHGREGFETLQRLNAESGILVEWKLLDELRDAGFELIPERDNKSSHDPERLYTALGRYGEPDQEVGLDEEAFGRAVDMAFAAFGPYRGGIWKSQPVRFLKPLPLDADTLWDALKLTKSSGAPYFQKKKEVFDKDLLIAKRVWDNQKAPPPCVSFFRIQHGEEGEKERLVWGYPQSMTILEALFAVPLIERFLRWRTPMVIGLRRYELDARLTQVEHGDLRYCFDYSRFDSRARAMLISKAMHMLRSHFGPMSDDLNVIWDKLVWYFIHTPIIMPDGHIWKKHRGVPSGSFFTQLVDSIINYIAVCYCNIRLSSGNGPEQEAVLVLGDDSVMRGNTYAPLRRWAEVMMELGIVLNVDKSLIARDFEDVHFLGHTWEKGVVNRPQQEIAKRLAFPERYDSRIPAQLRRNTRLTAYLNDAINSMVIVEKLSRYKGVYVPGYIASTRAPVPLTGWEELQSLIYGEPLLTPLESAYTGILL